MEEPDGLPSMGLHRVGHDLNDLAAGSHEGFPGGSDNKESTCSAGIEGDSGSIPGVGRSLEEGLGNPRQYSCLENPMDTGAWWATVHRVTKSQTQLKQLSMCTHSSTDRAHQPPGEIISMPLSAGA